MIFNKMKDNKAKKIRKRKLHFHTGLDCRKHVVAKHDKIAVKKAFKTYPSIT